MQTAGTKLAGTKYGSQVTVTSAGETKGHCALVNKQHLEVSPSPNHNPKLNFHLRGNCLSHLFVNRAVTCTIDLCPVMCVLYLPVQNASLRSQVQVSVQVNVLR